MNDTNSLARTKWNCKYHTVGKNVKKIQEYIQNQIKEDQISTQMILKEYQDPFTGSK